MLPGFLSYNILTEIICLMFAIIALRHDRSIWKTMIVFLAVVATTEVVGRQISHARMSNHWLYNIYLLLEAGFVGYMFYHLFPKRKGLVYSGLVIFLVSYSIEGYTSGFGHFFDVTNLISSTIFIILSLYYYYLLLNQSKFYNLLQYAPFWWVTGVLFFYFGGTVCNIFFSYLIQLTTAEIRIPLRYYIFNILNLVLYSCWSYAFVCRSRELESPSTQIGISDQLTE